MGIGKIGESAKSGSRKNREIGEIWKSVKSVKLGDGRNRAIGKIGKSAKSGNRRNREISKTGESAENFGGLEIGAVSLISASNLRCHNFVCASRDLAGNTADYSIPHF